MADRGKKETRIDERKRSEKERQKKALQFVWDSFTIITQEINDAGARPQGEENLPCEDNLPDDALVEECSDDEEDTSVGVESDSGTDSEQSLDDDAERAKG